MLVEGQLLLAGQRANRLYLDPYFSQATSRSQLTVGVAPMTLIGAYADWAAHLSYSPGKQLQLGEKALRKWLRLVGRSSGRTREPQIGTLGCCGPPPHFA